MQPIKNNQDPTQLKLPLYEGRVSAGFPSPADDYIDQSLDLNEYLVQHPASTFFVRVEGDSMVGASINHGDILIVDKSLDARNGLVVVATVNGEFTVKTFQKKGRCIYLVPANSDYSTITITDDMDFAIWGIVTNVIHPLV